MRFMYKDYYITIGLEIHAALKTEQKLFSSTPNSFSSDSFSLIDCAIPGALPILDKTAVEMACAFAFATNSELKPISYFERKHYFYPDLSLGYQITQQHKPIIGKGSIPIKVEDEHGTVYEKIVFIEHAHLECDAAKSIHDKYTNYTAIDLSRSGSPLLEIVSDPCMHSPKEAKEYAKRIHSIVTAIDICDGKMEEGSFRVDASISLSKDPIKLGTRVEIKNISSFGFLETALEYEIVRQFELLESQQSIVMQTRLFDEKTSSTIAMRDKETVQDYKYMFDPDIPVLSIDEIFTSEVKSKYFYDFLGLESFYQKSLKEEAIDIKQEHLLDLFKGKFKSYLISIYQDQSLIKEQKAKILKAIIFWLPDCFAKQEVTLLPKIEDIIELIKKDIDAKEFKEIISTWIKSPSVDILSLVGEKVDSTFIIQTIETIILEYQEQINDKKVHIDKRVQFIMGKCMQKLKGKAAAAQISIEVSKLLKNL